MSISSTFLHHRYLALILQIQWHSPTMSSFTFVICFGHDIDCQVKRCQLIFHDYGNMHITKFKIKMGVPKSDLQSQYHYNGVSTCMNENHGQKCLRICFLYKPLNFQIPIWNCLHQFLYSFLKAILRILVFRKILQTY